MLTMSQSKIKSWKYCPAQFFRSYILGLDPYNPKFEFGTDYHKLVEMYHKRQEHDFERHHRTGEILLGRDGKPLKEYIFDREHIAAYADVYPADFYDWPMEADAEQMQLNTQALTHFHRPDDAVDLTKMYLVERRISIKLKHPTTGKEIPLPFTCVMDGIRLNNPGRGIYDLKTSSVSWNQNMADTDIQATLYLYAWWQLTGELLPFSFIVVRKRPGPKTKPIQPLLTTTRTVEDFAALWNEFSDIVDQILNAQKYPCYCLGKPHQIIGVTE